MMCQPSQAGPKGAGFRWTVVLGCLDGSSELGCRLDCGLRGPGSWEEVEAQAGASVPLSAGQQLREGPELGFYGGLARALTSG